jgi:branched-chain amino acid transport system ATP-binding protein
MTRPAAGDVLLTTRDLSKSYGPFKAVDGVDLDVREHDIHVFIGPNGAGKSTVLNMLGGQILPTTGEVVFDGKNLGTTTPSWRARAGIGRSFQLTSIIPGFTCLENVVLAVQAHHGLFGLLRLRSRQ